MAPIITLTTDFGLNDPYVAAMKGIILSINPGATVVDVSHHVRPGSVEQAAFILACVYPYYPPDAIHVAVVDPGVGTERRAIALTTPAGTFIGPDNGVLSTALPDETREGPPEAPRSATLPSGVRGFHLAEPRFHHQPVSSTFHGRDVFAPVAAHLSLGVNPVELGPEINEAMALPPFRAAAGRDGSLTGRVLHVDRFGNLITNVRAGQLKSSRISVSIAGRELQGLARTYGEAHGIAAIVGSSGFLEIAVPGGGTSRELAAEICPGFVVRI